MTDIELEHMIDDYLDAHETRCASGNYYPWGRLQTRTAMHWAIDVAARLRFERTVKADKQEHEDPFVDSEVVSEERKK